MHVLCIVTAVYHRSTTDVVQVDANSPHLRQHTKRFTKVHLLSVLVYRSTWYTVYALRSIINLIGQHTKRKVQQ